MRHVAYLRANRAEICGAQYRHFATGGLNQASQGAEESSLPCPVVAQNRIEPSGRKFGGDSAQGGEASKLLDEISYNDDGREVTSRVGTGHNRLKILINYWAAIELPGVFELVMLFPGAAPLVPGCCGAYFEAHFACRPLA